jgi:hypothetical protein
MTLTTATYDTNTEQDAKAKPVAEHNLNSQVSAKKTLLSFTGYLTLAATIIPLMYTTGCLATIILFCLAAIMLAG